MHFENGLQGRETLRGLLHEAGIPCELVSAADPIEFPKALLRKNTDLILCDFTLSGPEGSPALALAREKLPGVPCLFVSATGTGPAAVESRLRLPAAVRGTFARVPADASTAPFPDQRSQTRKWQALRRFAQGVAHDFNNLLTVIHGHASVVLMREDLPEDVLRSLQQIYAAGERGSNLTRRLIAFGRGAALSPKTLDLNKGVRDFTATLGSGLGKNLALELVLDPALPGVSGDSDLIEHVLQNLVLRASSAMRGVGRLLVRTQFMDLAHADCPTAPRRTGRFCRLSVSDTGPAIAAELLSQLFEPFSAERKASDDTGLCLATVFGIVDNHRGWVEVESQPGSGTTFHVFLPALPVEAPAAAGVPAPEPPPPAGQGGETILLVEDEAPVREFARTALQHHGYRVLLAASGKDALETWQWHSSRISLLLTDLVLPDDFSGLDLARRLRAEKPTLKILCTSGYTPEALERQLSTAGNVRFLQKPYQIRLLAQAVRTSLDSS